MRSYEDVNALMDCPALRYRAPDFPFGNDVPRLLRMTTTVVPYRERIKEYVAAGELPPIAVVGAIFPAWTNSFGGVAVTFPDGQRISVSPYQYEVIEWHIMGMELAQ